MSLDLEVKKNFQKELDQEIFKSEILRAKILNIIFYFISIFFFILPTFLEEEYIKVFSNRINKYIPLAFFFIVGTYFLGLWNILTKFKIKEKPIPNIPRYVNAFIETSLPTVLLILLIYMRPDYPLYNLISPPFSAYFLFIILSGLRLNFKLSVFTGLVAGIEYFILAKFFQENNLSILATDYTVSTLGFFIRSFFFILAGIAIGYVTSEIEKRILHSFSLLNEKDKITNLFGQHVSPEVVEKLVNQSDFVSEIKHVSIMFFDIRNFTSFSEKRTATEVVEYLNQIFNFCIEIVNKNNGIINKFLGDGFMAVFGAPISNGNDVKNSVTASLEILNRIKLEVQEKNIPETAIGVGIHSGEAVTGNIGSSTRKEYTIIGDVVNLASRVEQLNKQFNSKILITEDVKKFLDQELLTEYLDEVNVKGREQKVKIYKVA